MPDALEAIAPSTREVEYAGERLVVQPLTVGQIPAVVRNARPVINSVLALEASDDDEGALVDLALDLIERHGEGIFEAAALLSGSSVDVIQRGAPDELVRLGRAIYEVNRDFFAQRLAPMLAEWRESRSAGAGKTPSTPSSPPATH
ncbi:MAG: hypothetical protein GX856_03825 [Gammaproteobacteria bacterium]|nr:hypothetical protein [Gammaproteobacteria bacterium]